MLTSKNKSFGGARGGNYFIAGGAVRGGQIVGSYPADLSDSGPNSVGRGRLIPTTSWEAIWNGVGEWFGVDAARMDAVLPIRSNFQNLFSASELFD